MFEQATVHFQTFGCQMNRLDTELMLGALYAEGYTSVDEMNAADVVLLNTCSVRERAENKVLSRLGLLEDRKRADPALTVGVVGCMAERDGENLLERFPHVDLVCGPAQIDRLPQLLEEVRLRGLRVLALGDKDVRFRRDVRMRPQRSSAYVTVMRGCDVRCTFCVVPNTRGQERSVPPVEVLDEVRRLAADGCVEVIFLGQTVDAYGKKFKEGYHLDRLLADAARVDGIRRVRFITSHPSFLDEAILRVMAGNQKVMPYLHLPLQAGSDQVLSRMRRRYTVDEYRRVVAMVRAHVPDAAIASDFIVGFPGETDREFEETVRMVEELRFASSFVFKYSPRPGTPAFDVADDVPIHVKKERNRTLLEVVDRLRHERNRSFVGEEVEVLVEGPSKLDAARLTGRTPHNDIVAFEGPPSLAGEIVRVRIDDCTALTLMGKSGGERRE